MNEAASKALFSAEVPNLPRLAAMRGWTVYQAEFPIFEIEFSAQGRRPLRVRVIAMEWNEQPPSVELLAPDGTRLRPGEAPTQAVFHQGPHPNTGYPFVCMVGTKEYHTHPSHVNDYWENYRRRENCGLLSLITQLWSAWLHASA
jgi:hypothetical protein